LFRTLIRLRLEEGDHGVPAGDRRRPCHGEAGAVSRRDSACDRRGGDAFLRGGDGVAVAVGGEVQGRGGEAVRPALRTVIVGWNGVPGGMVTSGNGVTARSVSALAMLFARTGGGARGIERRVPVPRVSGPASASIRSKAPPLRQAAP